jgi:hypothetical protein
MGKEDAMTFSESERALIGLWALLFVAEVAFILGRMTV